MGVDFYACKACGSTFPDCGDFTSCSEDGFGCGARFCDDECAKIHDASDGSIEWEEFDKLSEAEQLKHRVSCVDCRKELESDENLLAFLLEKIGKSHEQLVLEFRAAKGTV